MMLILMGGGFLMLCATALFVVRALADYHDVLEEELSGLAGVVAVKSAASIPADDSEAVREMLTALRRHSKVRIAAVYDAHGQLFVGYKPPRSDDVIPSQLPPRRRSSRLSITSMSVFEPVVYGGRPVGMVYLRVVKSGYRQLLMDYGSLLGMMLLVMLMIILLMSRMQQHLVVQRLVALSDRAVAFTQKGNYSLRVPVTARDEIGQLAESLNRMMDYVQQRDEDLRRHRDDLEDEVMRQTRELKESNRRLQMEVTDRVEAEEALRAREKMYRYLYDTAQVGLFRVDREMEHFITANRMMAEIFEYDTVEDFISHARPKDCYRDPEILQEHYALLLKERQMDKREVFVRSRSGAERCLLISARFYEEDGYIEGAFIDISDRRKTEDNLRETLEKLERMNRLMIGREQRTLELKKEVNDLLIGNGEHPRYRTTA
jgi:PAS domain S-box-containing protein